MELGAFSISLTVKDLEASRKFYEKFGFQSFGGDPSQNWLILKNGDHVIGLFHGMFERNILTFNPGWSQDAEALGEFTDVRELQRELKARGVTLTTEADAGTTGPAHFTLVDPDGNAILIPKPIIEQAMDSAACIGCGACVAACKNASAALFTSAKISQLSLLPQGQVERKQRAIAMVDRHDAEGFGSCSNEGECEAVCPKEIPITNIARMNREYLKAAVAD